MKTIVLSVGKPGCKGNVCQMPLELLPNIEKELKKITYNEKTEKAEITFDEKKVTALQVEKILKKRGYTVK